MPAFGENEICSYDEMEKHIKSIVFELTGY